jgi:hypothetical protein
MTTPSDIESRLTRLEDTKAFHDLASEYCHGLDKHDVDRFLAIWAADGLWDLGDGVEPKGHEELTKVLVDSIWAGFPTTHHWTSNHVIDWSGDTPTGECDVCATVRNADGQWLRAAATYEDVYVQVDGRWLISRRKGITHWAEPLAEPGA